MLDDVVALLAPPRRRAIEVALLLVEPGDVTPDSHAIGLGGNVSLDCGRARRARAGQEEQ